MIESALYGKKILLGVCGSIAAYKSALLVRLLKKAGADVQVIMTEAASGFITPLTLATLSEKPVLTRYHNPETGVWNDHVHLGLWADLLVIAPASANTIGKAANGLCDNLLMAVYQSARCSVVFAPAMDEDMFLHPALQSNINKLRSYGNHFINPEHGPLASGLVAQGRLAEPENILTALEDIISQTKNKTTGGKLIGKKVMVTAGPTHEAIDPVRFIGNHSTGKMGYAIAKALQQQGAEVILISGPVAINPPAGVQQIEVTSAEQMYRAALTHFPQSDAVILAAAVADYRPMEVATQKIKKKVGDVSGKLTLELVSNPDIAAALGKQKKHQKMIGFALETNNELAHAQSKLDKKNLDMIVLNSLQDKGAGFGTDTNKVTFIYRNGNQVQRPLESKQAVAQNIVAALLEMFQQKN